jgi:hypothetical protein
VNVIKGAMSRDLIDELAIKATAQVAIVFFKTVTSGAGKQHAYFNEKVYDGTAVTAIAWVDSLKWYVTQGLKI